jgi:hypothetical protein
MAGVDLNGDTRCNHRAEDFLEKNQGAGDERAVEEFYSQLWEKVEAVSPAEKRRSGVLVWIRKELVERRCFSEIDCYPFREGDTPSLVRCIRVSRGQWKSRRKPLVERLRRKCAMADWGERWRQR